MNQPSNTKLYIGNLSFEATEEDVKTLFGAFGEVKEVNIVTDRYTGRPRGFAFVEMVTADGATTAKKALDGQQFHSRDLSVDWARAREPGQNYGAESRGFEGSGRSDRGERRGTSRDRW